MSAASKEPPYNYPLGSCPSPSDVQMHVYTWRIANISSIVHEADYVVQSPSFLFEGATWILKLYPYGQTAFKSTGFIDVALEQKGLKEKVYCRLFCKDVFDKEIGTSTRHIQKSDLKFEIRNFMQNVKERPEKWKVAPDDIFTLVCELSKTVNPHVCNTSVGDAHKLSRNKGDAEIGEFFEECFELKSRLWKICKINSTPSLLPNDYKIQSESFTFAGATWILKVYPYFRMVTSNPSFDVQLERLQSEFPEHYIYLKIQALEQVELTLYFNACHTQGRRINFTKKNFDVRGCVHLTFQMKYRMNVGDEFHYQAKVMGPTAVNSNIAGTATAPQHNKVLQDFKDLYLKQEDCDVVMKVKGQEFPAHSLILKARSPVLASAFRSDMKEKASGIFEIEDCDPSSFSDFLHFIYCGEIQNLSEKNAFSLFTTADKYDIPYLKAACMEFMKQNLSIETFCDTIALALLHSETELISISTDFFQKNLQEIIVTVEWQSFLIENPIRGNELLIKALVPKKIDHE